MNLNQARDMRANDRLLSAEILPSPNKDGGWFLTILDHTCKSFLLVDEQDQVITMPTVDDMVQLVRAIGLRTVSIRLG